jgi:hypothetical protein
MESQKCPLVKEPPHFPDNLSPSQADCGKGLCSWWDADKSRCAILSIAIMLSCMYNYGINVDAGQ